MVRSRSTSRVVLLDADGAALLFLTYGKDHAVPPRWITPGGGVDPGEDFVAAARRELFEETGLRVAEVGEPWRVDDFDVEQRWHPYERGRWAWFAVRAARFEPSDEHWMPDERNDIVAHRWWRADELDAERPEVEPADLADRIRTARALLARRMGPAGEEGGT